MVLLRDVNTMLEVVADLGRAVSPTQAQWFLTVEQVKQLIQKVEQKSKPSAQQITTVEPQHDLLELLKTLDNSKDDKK
jgi:hypothetical protein